MYNDCTCVIEREGGKRARRAESLTHRQDGVHDCQTQAGSANA